MQTVSHDGRETAYRRTDFGHDAPPVLFVHGSGGTHEVWTGQYGRRENEYPAVALDLSGHGDSADVDTAPGYETLDAYVADVRAVVRETGAELLVGNSLGGAVVLQTVLESDVDPAGIVLAGTGAKLTVHPDVREWLAEDFERAIEFLHGDDMLFHDPDPAHVERSKTSMRDVGRAVTERDFRSCHEFDVRDRLDEVDVPALALVGEYDSLTPVEYHEYLAENIPDADFVEIANAAHLAMVEQPEAFTGAISMFCQRL
ncbi:alpha/beta fold hydrolase [Halorientalis brevis]|uniref:Alpha/beta fold hydrolase n=1 Tax=Halorientalis brevis TaxID=1126241 RepID=A0ABD6CER1_9EURY|nr:alpha/beta hydrolase [Halorientalis brevis]